MSKGDRSCKVILAHLGQVQEEESVRTHERSLENQPEGASAKLRLRGSPPPSPAPSHAREKAGLKPITGNPAVLGGEQTLKIISPRGDTGWKYKLLPEGFR